MKTHKCKACGAEMSHKWSTSNKYCNNTCQHIYQNREKVRVWIAGGSTWRNKVPNWVKEYLAERDGDCCSACGIKEWLGMPLVLECDHIDGNAENNDPENLRLLCSNCHSQTPTYKNRNAGKGRKARRMH